MCACWDGTLLSLEAVILENQQDLLDPSSFQICKPCDCSKQLNKSKSALLKSRVVIFIFVFFLLRILNTNIPCSLQLRVLPTFSLSVSSSLVVSLRFSKMSSLIGSSFTCVRKLSLVYLRNPPDYLCPAMLYLLYILGWSFPWGKQMKGVFSVVWRRSYLLPDQAVCSRHHTQQCCPLV